MSVSSLHYFFFPTVLQCAVCRDVTLPPGALYRVAGFPLSLPCVVSGFEGPRTQEFEWFLYKDDAGDRQIGVVSTRDKGFPYALYQARVKNGEVRVERDSGDKVRLVIQKLRAEDEGTFECYTPSTDSTYQGNYSDKVSVRGTVYPALPIEYFSSMNFCGIEVKYLILQCTNMEFVKREEDKM